jgi:hypothetical protein
MDPRAPGRDSGIRGTLLVQGVLGAVEKPISGNQIEAPRVPTCRGRGILVRRLSAERLGGI